MQVPVRSDDAFSFQNSLSTYYDVQVGGGVQQSLLPHSWMELAFSGSFLARLISKIYIVH